MQKHKYWKSLLGLNAEIFVPKNIAYSAKADFKTFATTAVEGEFAFYNADTQLLVPSASAAAANTNLFFAVFRNGLVETSRVFTIGRYTLRRSAYAAPTSQAVRATLAGTPVAGREYSLKVIELTQAYQAFPTWVYNYTAVTGDTVTTVAAALVARINDANNAVNKNSDPIVTASNAAGVITLTATGSTIQFRVAFSLETLTDLTAVAAYTGAGTAVGYLGNGTFAAIAELELQANIYKGVTTNTGNSAIGATPADFGIPTSFADSANQYATYTLIGTRTEANANPTEQHVAPHHIVLAIPSSGTNPDAAVKTILGL